MENKRPLILISNDDGVVSKGISELVRFLRTMGDIVVMAPDMPRSGVSCAVTLDTPIHCQMVRQDVGLNVYRCSGTPTDCVKLAFYAGVLDRQPDIVVSGINHGDNSSINSHYSGTMGAVREGCLRGIPSVAFSLCSHDPNADFEAAGPYIREIVQKVLDRGLPPLTCLNVNFPDVAPLKGIRVCQQAKGEWNDEFEHFEHRGDSHYYWMKGDYSATDADDERTDYWALTNGYVAITPTTVDVTARDFVDDLTAWFKDEE